MIHHLCALLCGFSALGCQVLWSKLLSLHLGFESVSVLASILAFLGGMAAGGWWVDGFKPGLAGAGSNAWRCLAWTQAGAGLCAYFIPLALIPVARWSLGFGGHETFGAMGWLLAIGAPGLVIVPAAFCAGTALPILACVLGEASPQTADKNLTCLDPDLPFKDSGRIISTGPDGRASARLGFGRLYFYYTLGACAGCLLPLFGFAPWLGFRHASVPLACASLICSAMAWARARRHQSSNPTGPGNSVSVAPSQGQRKKAVGIASQSVRRRRVLFATGTLILGYEIAGIRVLSQMLENTVYTFGVVLAVFLVGSAAGGWASSMQGLKSRADSFGSRVSVEGIALWSAGLWMLLMGFCFAGAGWLLGTARRFLDAGNGWLGALCAEATVTAIVFIPPAFGFGFIYARLAEQERRETGAVGRLLAWNTAGAAIGSLAAGFSLIPAIGTRGTMLALALGSIALARTFQALNWVQGGWIAGIVALGAWVGVAGQPADNSRGAKTLWQREGVLASTRVEETPDGHRVLKVNERFLMGGTAAAVPQKKQAHIPLALHPAPKRALFLGPGTGITLAGALDYPGLEIEAVEIVPEILQAMRWFESHNSLLGGRHPRIRFVTADARRFMRQPGPFYDVIVADLFHPARDGAGALYSLEHFLSIRARLAANGLFCQWLPLYQLDASSLRIIVRTFLAAFPHSQCLLLQPNADLPVLGLMGGIQPLQVAADWLEKSHPQAEALKAGWRAVGLPSSIALAGSVVAGTLELKRFAGEGPFNTDDRPVVMFQAPRIPAVAAGTRSGRLLLDLLRQWSAGEADSPQSFDPNRGGGGGFAAAVRDYKSARNLYLAGLHREAEGDLEGAIVDYLAAARSSLHFTAAYARCVTIIQMKAALNKTAARALFERLEAAQPSQPLGRQLLGPLFPPSEL